MVAAFICSPGELSLILRAGTHARRQVCKDWSVQVTKKTDTVLWCERRTGKAGFVDLQTFTLLADQPSAGQTQVEASSVARDVHGTCNP